MSEERNCMEQAIKDIVVPILKNSGFKGSFPHFRRACPQRIDLLSFQFYSSGGSFVVEIATAPLEGVTTNWGKHIPPNKLNVTWVSKRLRLGANEAQGKADHWFVYGRRSYEPEQPLPQPKHFQAVAQEVAGHIKSQAEPWWSAC